MPRTPRCPTGSHPCLTSIRQGHTWPHCKAQAADSPTSPPLTSIVCGPVLKPGKRPRSSTQHVAARSGLDRIPLLKMGPPSGPHFMNLQRHIATPFAACHSRQEKTTQHAQNEVLELGPPGGPETEARLTVGNQKRSRIPVSKTRPLKH